MRKKDSHPTLSDVARRAGVGTTTVSRVINGGDRVSPKTLVRVQEIIAQIGFMPNQAARTLKGKRTKTIGLVIPSIADSFFASCAEAAQDVAKAHDSLLIVTASGNDPIVELENLNVLMRHRPDGLLLAPSDPRNPLLAAFLKRSPVPVISFDRPLSDGHSSSVVVKNYAGARNATTHLIEHGYQRILCMGGEPELYTIRERLRGYCHAMEEAGLPVLSDLSVMDHQSAEAAIARYMADAKDRQAIFTLKNSATIFAFEALQKLGVPVPSSVALIGFDDFELAETLRPAISVVQQPVEDVGRIAAEMLFRCLLQPQDGSDGHLRQGSHSVRLDTKLILRNSCGCAGSAG